MIDCNWASFVTLCHHQNTNKLCHCQCQICCQSPSQFRYPRRPRQTHPSDPTHRYHFHSIKLQNCKIQPLSSCKTPSKSLPLLSLATAHAGTLKMAGQKDRNDQSQCQNTRTIYSQPSAINSNLHNTSIMRPRDLLWCFQCVLMTFSAVIMGISPMTQNMLSMPDGTRRIEWYARERNGLRSPPDYARLNGRPRLSALINRSQN